MSEHVWYFLKESFAGESQEGPLTEPQFVQLVKKGHVKKSTKICSPTRTKGQWTTVEQVPSIAALIGQGKQERAQEKATQAASKINTPANSGDAFPAGSHPSPGNSPVSPPQPPTSVPGMPVAPGTAAPSQINPVSIAPTPPDTIPQLSSWNSNAEFKSRVYPWLSIVRYTCYVLAGLATINLVVSTILGIIGLVNTLQISSEFFWMALTTLGITVFAQICIIIFLVFLANMIKLLIDVQSNTELTALNTSKMASRQ